MREKAGGDLRIGVFLCHCGTNIAGVLDMAALGDFAARLPRVVNVAANLYTCSEAGQQEIVSVIRENSLNRAVIEGWLIPTEPVKCQVCEHCATNCPLGAIRINRRSKILF
jgi:heterodisulfide reductase subunit A-like polyferredoxin